MMSDLFCFVFNCIKFLLAKSSCCLLLTPSGLAGQLEPVLTADNLKAIKFLYQWLILRGQVERFNGSQALSSVHLQKTC